ncbi:hypothetical protein VE01_10551 [Pseudogymnoascus verrucosus]|uniref:Uncharacterized protein n=1 Tax=Pseudogymnoascus verrucosus TaxID=342668 RepID=A0A1B8G6L4_9PEZI|nr:uncharacterized protein VE01_10551 [Pseudogymnoascus verrucosus]OBT91465.1 hypothetical protein VE01_10551 [Pseudogymnoascus verrucosus]
MGANVITEVPTVPIAAPSSKAHATVVVAPGVKVTLPPYSSPLTSGNYFFPLQLRGRAAAGS